MQVSRSVRLIDTHAHLMDRRFDTDRSEVVKRARQAGVDMIINVGYDLESSRQAIKLAEADERMYAAIGIHPHDAGSVTAKDLATLEQWANTDKQVIAIGEIGLDYHYDNSPREAQKWVFIEQLQLAHRAGLPVIIHNREAHGDTLQILQDFCGQTRGSEMAARRGVLHCFSGSAEMAKQVMDKGFYISFAGPITFKNARKARQVAESIPLERCLVETDCPYLAPEPRRGRRNEPAYVRFVAEQLAREKGAGLEELARRLRENVSNLFGIP